MFNPEQLVEMLENVKPPVAQLALEGDEWKEHYRGELLLYENVDPSETYYIGADVVRRIRGGDWSVAQVLTSGKKQVATLFTSSSRLFCNNPLSHGYLF